MLFGGPYIISFDLWHFNRKHHYLERKHMIIPNAFLHKMKGTRAGDALKVSLVFIRIILFSQETPVH